MTLVSDNWCMLWRTFGVGLGLAALLVCSGCAWVVQYPVTSASAGVWGATGRGPTDHAISNATGQDCDLTRMVDLQPVCQNRPSVEIEERTFSPIEAKRQSK